MDQGLFQVVEGVGADETGLVLHEAWGTPMCIDASVFWRYVHVCLEACNRLSPKIGVVENARHVNSPRFCPIKSRCEATLKLGTASAMSNRLIRFELRAMEVAQARAVLPRETGLSHIICRSQTYVPKICYIIFVKGSSRTQFGFASNHTANPLRPIPLTPAKKCSVVGCSRCMEQEHLESPSSWSRPMTKGTRPAPDMGFTMCEVCDGLLNLWWCPCEYRTLRIVHLLGDPSKCGIVGGRHGRMLLDVTVCIVDLRIRA